MNWLESTMITMYDKQGWLSQENYINTVLRSKSSNWFEL